MRLGEWGLRLGERFTDEDNYFAAWACDLRVERITRSEPGRTNPRCVGGRRAGPPEDRGGPWVLLEQTQAQLVFDATLRTAQILGMVLDERDIDVTRVGEYRDELARLLPAACCRCWAWSGSTAGRSTALWSRSPRPGEGGVKLTGQLVPRADDDTETIVREVFTFQREDPLAPDSLGLRLDEAKDLLVAVRDTLVVEQVATAVSAQVDCPDCGVPRRHKDSRPIVVRTLFGRPRWDSPRWCHCGCQPRTNHPFSPLASILPQRSTPELS